MSKKIYDLRKKRLVGANAQRGYLITEVAVYEAARFALHQRIEKCTKEAKETKSLGMPGVASYWMHELRDAQDAFRKLDVALCYKYRRTR